MSALNSLLFPQYRQRVLTLLLLNPTQHYHVREIARLTHTTAGSLHRELSKLAKADILCRKVSGNQVYYQANSSLPIYEELASILRKTSGIGESLASSLLALIEKIEVAFIYGSVASGTENSTSDIDLLIIGEVNFIDVVKTLHATQISLHREINPKIYTRKEWLKLAAEKNSFIENIKAKPKIFIVGSNDDIAQCCWLFRRYYPRKYCEKLY